MKILKSLLFYPMMLIRGLFLRIVHLLAGLCILGLIMTFFLDNTPINLPFIFLIIGSLLEALAYFYDIILIKLNPTDNELILHR
ncbi:hypothetical protein [Arcobacter sp.]|uniref:hypothetical protein n=1 Tax=unclassified Arcobacter TaxID=2593671 RepID=UPI003AFFE1EA